MHKGGLFSYWELTNMHKGGLFSYWELTNMQKGGSMFILRVCEYA
jgi:hypothetical protein